MGLSVKILHPLLMRFYTTIESVVYTLLPVIALWIVSIFTGTNVSLAPRQAVRADEPPKSGMAKSGIAQTIFS